MNSAVAKHCKAVRTRDIAFHSPCKKFANGSLSARFRKFRGTQPTTENRSTHYWPTCTRGTLQSFSLLAISEKRQKEADFVGVDHAVELSDARITAHIIFRRKVFEMPVIICPGCGTRLKVDPQPAGKFACPKCQKVMRLASTSSNEPSQSNVNATTKAPLSSLPNEQTSRPSQRPKVNPLNGNPPTTNSSNAVDPFSTDGMGLPPIDGGYAASGNLQYPSAGSSTYLAGSSSVSRSRQTDVKAFANKLAIFAGIIALAIIVSLPLTYVKNSFLCLIPILLVILALLGFVFWARIWFIALGFAQSSTQGLMVLFVPYYWLFFLSKNKQQCIKPLLVFGASLVPGLLGVMVITFFKPDFAGSSSRADLRLTSAQQAQARQILLKATSNAKPGELLTVQFPIFTMMKPDPSILGELALLQLPGYVQGSFKISPDQKNLTFQYRGSDRTVALHYAMALPGDAGIMVGFEPSFIDSN